MTESITSSQELRQFATENSGRRKIDVEASIDLHTRAAAQIDLLGEHVTDLQGRLANAISTQSEAFVPAAPAPVQTPAPAEEPSTAALMILQKAQATAEETLAEAEEVLSEAETTRQQADALVRAKVDAALAEARGQALHIIEEAEAEAVHISEAAEAAAAQITATGHKAADRAAFIQRQTKDRTARLVSDAEELVGFARGMEALAADEAAAMIADTPVQTSQPIEPVEETPEFEPPSAVSEAPAAAAEQPPAVVDAPPPPPPPAVVEQPVVASAEFRPPPPPPAPAAATEVLDLTEAELETALEGRSIDDELFDDDEVIDLTDTPEPTNTGGFEFFGKD